MTEHRPCKCLVRRRVPHRAVPRARGAASNRHGIKEFRDSLPSPGIGRWLVGTGERRRRAISAGRIRRSSGERTVARSVSGNQLVTSTRKARGRFVNRSRIAARRRRGQSHAFAVRVSSELLEFIVAGYLLSRRNEHPHGAWRSPCNARQARLRSRQTRSPPHRGR
jgi:hypothetical protein